MSVLLLGNLTQQDTLLCTLFLMGSSIRLLWWASSVTVCWMFASLWLDDSIFLLLFGLLFGSLILLCPSLYWELQVATFNRSSQLISAGCLRVWFDAVFLFVYLSVHLFLLFFPLLWVAINLINSLIRNPNYSYCRSSSGLLRIVHFSETSEKESSMLFSSFLKPVSILHAWGFTTYVCAIPVCLMPVESRGGYQIPWNQSYRQFVGVGNWTQIL